MVIFESLGALAFLCAEYRNKTFKRFKSIEIKMFSFPKRGQHTVLENMIRPLHEAGAI